MRKHSLVFTSTSERPRGLTLKIPLFTLRADIISNELSTDVSCTIPSALLVKVRRLPQSSTDCHRPDSAVKKIINMFSLVKKQTQKIIEKVLLVVKASNGWLTSARCKTLMLH